MIKLRQWLVVLHTNRVMIASSRRVHRVHVQQWGGLRIVLMRTSRNSGNDNNAYCTRSRFLLWRRHECIRAITSRYYLHDQLIARILKNLRLWSSKRDDPTICGSWRCRFTVRRVADAVRDTIATLATRHDCTTRNWNEYSCFHPDLCEMRG